MKRTLAVALTSLALVTACGDEGGPRNIDDAGADAGPLLPDARVVVPTDSGTGPTIPAPTLTTVSPGSGSERGGSRVTLRGTSFVEPAEVFFGDVPATSVVVLDEVSIAATTPAGMPGAVTVKVTTPGGTAELVDGFRYHKELLVLDVTPQRLPDVGGVLVTITGKGFDAQTIVLLDRKPLAGAELVDAEHIRGFAPALAPGRPEIRALTPEAEARRSDLVVVYATPRPAALAAGYGPRNTPSAQTVAGLGFDGATRVTIGGVASTELTFESSERLTLASPRLAVGVHDVVVENADATGTLAGGFIAYDPARTTFEVLGVTPPTASTAGGEVVVVVGHGFATDATVLIGGVAATVVGTPSANAITVLVPAGVAIGRADVVISSASQGASATGTGVITIHAPIEVTSISPVSGPAAGGTDVTIRGRGFTSGAVVKLGAVALANVVVVSDTELTGTTVAGSHGATDVVVEQGGARGVLARGFAFVEPFEIIHVEPSEGSIAGNTYVSIFGRGLDAPASVKFGGNDGLDPILENGSVIGVRTQPAVPSRVDVTITSGANTVVRERAYAFYDPRLITGGAWGGPIEGSVNVAVLDINSGAPMPGMVVQLGHDADLRYTGITDENGLATISSPEIRGPYTVTAGMNGFEFVTFNEVNARNLTMFSSRYPSSPAPEDPVPPCPEGAEPPRVRGRIFRFKTSLDPVTSSGWFPVALITYSQPSVFSTNPPQPPEQEDQVTSEGEEYEIVVMRAGTVAVYAILYDYNPTTQQAIPRKMGIVRNVPAAPGVVTEPIDISLDIELNQQVTVHLDDPPVQSPGPTLNAVFPYLNLQSEGVIAFPPTAVGSNDVVLSQLPELATSQFFYMGGSFTLSATGGLGAPYSLTLRESGEAFEEGLELGPFVQMPENVTPKANQVIRSGVLDWDQGGVKPDITTIQVLDVTSVSGCCCVDLNANGTCESAEPQQCGGAPVQYQRWSVYGQGGAENYSLPAMPPGLEAFDSPNTYFWLVQQAVAPRFNYGEFIYNQFSPYFWTSWSLWFSQFVSKEETR
ncbi:IPT/TIG domain-containing protein [Myxococcota bacterium]|nr:IPT/TIG domain-containing protein [Myxococcota bacterium]